MFKNKLLVSSLLIALSAPVLAEIDKTVLATVNGRDVIAEELIMTAQQNKIDYAVLNDVQKKMLLNGLVNRILVANEAKKQKLDKDPETMIKLDALIDSVLAATLLEAKTKEYKISDAELKEFYDKNILKKTRVEFKAKHILVKDENDAKAIFKQLEADSSKFAEVAKSKSIDKGSAVKGGDLGWFNPAVMVPSFGEAVKTASIGKIVAPVKSDFGWHIILVEETRDVKPPNLEDSKAKIEAVLIKEKVTAYLDTLEKNATIDIKIGK